jgi:protein-S-isoprenylcysteine O-methyltransferase Ste14
MRNTLDRAGGRVVVLVAQLAGLALFILGTVVLGMRLRRAPSLERAESLSRVSHLLFWVGLVLPWTVGVFFPGGAALDRLAGLPAIPVPLVFRLIVGVPMLVFGVVLMQLSINALKRKGKGAPALVLTQEVVHSGVYGAVRNPMALGFYVALIGGALLTGSTYVTLYSLGIIAAHAFNLKYFEELELRSRYGESYECYASSTPFLVPRWRSRNAKP